MHSYVCGFTLAFDQRRWWYWIVDPVVCNTMHTGCGSSRNTPLDYHLHWYDNAWNGHLMFLILCFHSLPSDIFIGISFQFRPQCSLLIKIYVCCVRILPDANASNLHSYGLLSNVTKKHPTWLDSGRKSVFELKILGLLSTCRRVHDKQ